MVIMEHTELSMFDRMLVNTGRLTVRGTESILENASGIFSGDALIRRMSHHVPPYAMVEPLKDILFGLAQTMSYAADLRKDTVSLTTIPTPCVTIDSVVYRVSGAMQASVNWDEERKRHRLTVTFAVIIQR